MCIRKGLNPLYSAKGLNSHLAGLFSASAAFEHGAADDDQSEEERGAGAQLGARVDADDGSARRCRCSATPPHSRCHNRRLRLQPGGGARDGDEWFT